jgi:isopenicillin-N epimerase
MSGSPAFGHRMLAEWMLDPSILYLNHGTVGATPRRVLRAQQEIRDEIERQPAEFLLRELTDIGDRPPSGARTRLRTAADRVGEFLGVRGGDLVFTDNVTTAINAVLRSFRFEPGDEVVSTQLAYGAILNAARYAAGQAGATLRVVELPDPPTPEGAAAAVVQALGPRTRLVVVDHITSESALLLPVETIARQCRERGIPILIDGAHAPGAIALDIAAIGADWYAANLHKWAWAPRSCGILWASPERQRGVHPSVISWGLEQGFTREFDWVGTRDPSPWLAAPAAIDLLREWGWGEIRRSNHALAWEAGRILSRAWGVPFTTPEAMIATMVTVPLPERLGSTAEDAYRHRRRLFEEDRIEVQLHAWRGRLWVRVSAQIYNEIADIHRLAEAVSALGPVTNEA